MANPKLRPGDINVDDLYGASSAPAPQQQSGDISVDELYGAAQPAAPVGPPRSIGEVYSGNEQDPLGRSMGAAALRFGPQGPVAPAPPANPVNEYLSSLFATTSPFAASKFFMDKLAPFSNVQQERERRATIDTAREQEGAFAPGGGAPRMFLKDNPLTPQNDPVMVEGTLGRALTQGAAFAGGLVGNLEDPVTAATAPLGVGKHLLSGMAKQAGLGAILDAPAQLMDVATGTQDKYDPAQTAEAAATQAGIHGLVHAVGHLFSPNEVAPAASAAAAAPAPPPGPMGPPSPRDLFNQDFAKNHNYIIGPDGKIQPAAAAPAAPTPPIETPDAAAHATQLAATQAAQAQRAADKARFGEYPDAAVKRRKGESDAAFNKRSRMAQDRSVENENIRRSQTIVAEGDSPPSTPAEPPVVHNFPDIYSTPDGRPVVISGADGDNVHVKPYDVEAGKIIGDAEPETFGPDQLSLRKPGGNYAPNQGAEAGRGAVEGARLNEQAKARGAFRLAERQKARDNPPATRDTQPAGRPEGVQAQNVLLDGEFPVKVLGPGVDHPTHVRVQQYDPRTGEVKPDSIPYEVAPWSLTESKYSAEPRQAQDFVQRAKGPKTPEQPRMPDEPVQREPAQTFRTTAPDPADGLRGRSPLPPQPEGPHPGPDKPPGEAFAYARAKDAEEILRRKKENAYQPGADDKKRAQADYEGADPKTFTTKAADAVNGVFETDDYGHVKSTGGGPIKFKTQKQAAQWIINVGHTVSEQPFELGNHPSGNGFTAYEYKGARDTPKPEAPRALPPPKSHDEAKARVAEAEAEHQRLMQEASSTPEVNPPDVADKYKQIVAAHRAVDEAKTHERAFAGEPEPKQEPREFERDPKIPPRTKDGRMFERGAKRTRDLTPEDFGKQATGLRPDAPAPDANYRDENVPFDDRPEKPAVQEARRDNSEDVATVSKANKQAVDDAGADVMSAPRMNEDGTVKLTADGYVENVRGGRVTGSKRQVEFLQGHVSEADASQHFTVEPHPTREGDFVVKAGEAAPAEPHLASRKVASDAYTAIDAASRDPDLNAADRALLKKTAAVLEPYAKGSPSEEGLPVDKAFHELMEAQATRERISKRLIEIDDNGGPSTPGQRLLKHALSEAHFGMGQHVRAMLAEAERLTKKGGDSVGAQRVFGTDNPRKPRVRPDKLKKPDTKSEEFNNWFEGSVVTKAGRFGHPVPDERHMMYGNTHQQPSGGAPNVSARPFAPIMDLPHVVYRDLGFKHGTPVFVSMRNPVELKDDAFAGPHDAVKAFHVATPRAVDALRDAGALSPEQANQFKREAQKAASGGERVSLLRKVAQAVKENGFDGVKYRNMLFAVEPGQVKSSRENTGQFDRRAPSILYSNPFMGREGGNEKPLIDLTDKKALTLRRNQLQKQLMQREYGEKPTNDQMFDWIKKHADDFGHAFDENPGMSLDDYAAALGKDKKYGDTVYSNPLDPKLIKDLLVDPAVRWVRNYGKKVWAEDEGRADTWRMLASAGKNLSPKRLLEGTANLASVYTNADIGAQRMFGRRYPEIKADRSLEDIMPVGTSPITWAADQVGSDPGSGRVLQQSFDSAAVQRFRQTASRLDEILHGMDAPQREHIARVLLRQEKAANAGETAKAKDLRMWLNSQFDYMKKAGVDVKSQTDYYARIIDEEAVEKNQKEFIDQAARVYMLSDSTLDAVDARAKATAWANNILYPVSRRTQGFASVMSNGIENPVKRRVLSSAADKLLDKFYVRDPRVALSAYANRTSRLAEYTRRFGQNSEKLDRVLNFVRTKMHPDDFAMYRDHVWSATGVNTAGAPPSAIRTAASWIQVMGMARLLARTGVAQLTEPVSIAMRANDKNPLGGYWNFLKQFEYYANKSPQSKDDHRLAQLLGITGEHAKQMFIDSRINGLSGALQQRMAANMMERVGVTYLTEHQRVLAMHAGQLAIKYALEDAADNKNGARLLLGEYGIDHKKDAPAMLKWLTDLEKGPRAAYEDTIAWGENPHAAKYRAALFDFATKSILEPNAAMTPHLAKNPFWSQAYAITSFSYAFAREIRNRAFVQAGKFNSDGWAAVAPLVHYMAAMIPISILVNDQARNAIFASRFNKEQSPMSSVMGAISATGSLGSFDRIVNFLVMNGRFERDPATMTTGPYMAGPMNTVNTIWKGMPWYSGNSPDTNTDENNAVKAAYQGILAPMALIAFAQLPVPGIAKLPAAIAGAYSTSSDASRGVADAVAGPKPERRGTKDAEYGDEYTSDSGEYSDEYK